MYVYTHTHTYMTLNETILINEHSDTVLHVKKIKKCMLEIIRYFCAIAFIIILNAFKFTFIHCAVIAPIHPITVQ